MKQIFTVFNFELRQKIKEKTFYLGVIIISLIFFAATFIPAILNYMNNNDSQIIENSSAIDMENEDSEVSDIEKESVVVLYNEGIDESVKKLIEENYNITLVNNLEELKNKINNEQFEKGIYIDTNTNAVVYKYNSSINTFEDFEFKNILENNYRYNLAIKDLNISPEALINIDNTLVSASIESIGKNPIIGYITSYIAVFFLYFMVLLYGQNVATSVAKEKDNRTMELLITNVKPKSMIFGKVLAAISASAIQIFSVFLSVFLGFIINIKANSIPQELINQILTDINLSSIVVFILFTLVGITMYYFIFAALGSLVSRLDEMNQALSPVLIIFVISFMIPMITMTIPDSIIMKVASFVPFTSPLAMFVRYQMTQVNMIEIVVSFIILLSTTILMSFLSVKIYRNGTLSYGNRLNLIKAITTKNE